MTTDTDTDRGRPFVMRVLPWLLAAGMLAVYVLMMEHSPTPNNLNRLSVLKGWTSRPFLFGPGTYLFTWPLSWLPHGVTAFKLNLFAAVCAALSLALLARSVALLPHDRTYAQRQREENEFGILTIPTAWLPPLLAVLACGLQMTFWESATGALGETADTKSFGIDAAGEMFGLLIFAYAVRCLLEYRVSQRESWLVRFALAYGLGMADNWAMIGFFPAFFAALVWIKGLDFFNLRFLARTFGCGLLGFSVIFLFPLMVSHNPDLHFGFGQVLKSILAAEKQVLVQLSRFPREMLLLLSLTSLLPVFLIGIRWASHFGDSSPIGILLATCVFHFVHAVLLVACIWAALDSSFSPRQLLSSLPLLTLYYLGALSIGYFSGYFLLVFGRREIRARNRPHPLVQALNVAITLALWLLAVAVPVVLVCKNKPRLETNRAVLAATDRYFSRIVQALPPRGAVVLSDDTARLFHLQGLLERSGRKQENLLIDTGSLLVGDSQGKPSLNKPYFDFLERTCPGYNLSVIRAGMTPDHASDLDLVHMLEQLAESHEIYYLHPSFGYYFERFYQLPRGPVYQLKLYSTNDWLSPGLTPDQLAQNKAYWQEESGDDIRLLIKSIQKPEDPKNPNPWQRFIKSARLTAGANDLALVLGKYYSRALDFFGVELAKAGSPEESGKFFEQATQINPDNASAKINLEFNRKLQAGEKPKLQSPKAFEDEMGNHRSWLQVINDGGPFDEPSFCETLGGEFATGHNFRQAVQQFSRVQALTPELPVGSVQLANLYVWVQTHASPMHYAYPSFTQTSSNALEAADRALQIAPGNTTALLLKSGILFQMEAYEQAIPLLNQLVVAETNNYRAFLFRGIANLKLDRLDAARQDYEMVAQVAPKSFPVNYGLGEIAYRQKRFPDAIKYAHLYLTNIYENFPTNKAAELQEVKQVIARLKELEPGEH